MSNLDKLSELASKQSDVRTNELRTVVRAVLMTRRKYGQICEFELEQALAWFEQALQDNRGNQEWMQKAWDKAKEEAEQYLRDKEITNRIKERWSRERGDYEDRNSR